MMINAVAISVLVAVFIVGLFTPPSILTWSQRSIRFRARTIVILCCVPSLLTSTSQQHGVQILATFASYIIASGLYGRHLKGKGSKWFSKRFVTFSRLALLGSAGIAATTTLFVPEILIAITLSAGIWYAFVIRSESHEITGHLAELQTKLISFEATRLSVTQLNNSAAMEHRDNSHKAS